MKGDEPSSLASEMVPSKLRRRLNLFDVAPKKIDNRNDGNTTGADDEVFCRREGESYVRIYLYNTVHTTKGKI